MDKKVIHTVFEQVVERYPSRIAIESANDTVTYRDLNGLANRLAHLLERAGCSKGNIVNVVASSSIELVGAMLGIFKSGCIYLPVDLSFAEKRLRQIFRETNDGIVIVTREHYEPFLHLARKLEIRVDRLIVIGDHRDFTLFGIADGKQDRIPVDETPQWQHNPNIEVSGEDSNYIFYTSGSTGEGKPILGAHASLSHFIHWETKEFGLDESVRVSQLTQMTFDASLRDIHVPLICGGTLCIPSKDIRTSPSGLLKWLETSRISLVHCVPSLFRLLTKELLLDEVLHYDLSRLEYILMAGESLYAKDIINWRKIVGQHIKLVNLYGATEATLIKVFYRIEAVSDNPSQPIPVGGPIGNTSIAIIRGAQACKIGEIGEIYIKTPFLTKGYYKNEKLTALSFVQNPLQTGAKDIVYKTGDLGRYLPDGNIEVLGRVDNQVKFNGIRVELEEVEMAMLEQGGITGAVVKAHMTEDNSPTLIAYYTGEEIDAESLAELLGRSLNRQIIPSFFIHLREFHLNINGKIDKKALPLPEDIIMCGEHFEAPVGDLENRLSVLWMEILGLKKTGRDISFFSVGGHSLRAIQLASRIFKEFGVELKIADIFINRTIREQAALIARSEAGVYTRIEAAPVLPHYPLSSTQRRFWIVSQSEEANRAYSINDAFILEGGLDPVALEIAFQELTDRHEIFRTLFKEDDTGEIRQYIRAPEESIFRISHTDLRDDPAQEEKVRAMIRSELQKPFDLSLGTVLRIYMYRLRDDKWVFSFNMHHMISDGNSMEVFMADLLWAYDAARAGAHRVKPPLRIQYKDFAYWQQGLMSGNDFLAHRDYWMKQLEGDLPRVTLPTEKARPPIKTYNAGIVKRVINAELLKKLKTLASRQEATLYMALLAITDVLLYANTGQTDIIIGSPMDGRIHEDLQEQVGCFLNTLALRMRLSGEQSFLELLQNARQISVKAYEHQAYPFDQLVEDLKLRRDLSRNMLFDIWMVLQDTEKWATTQERWIGDTKVTPYGGDDTFLTKFDLQFLFAPFGKELQAYLEYNVDVLDRKVVERISGQMEQVIRLVTANPALTLAEIVQQLLTSEQEFKRELRAKVRTKNLKTLKIQSHAG